MSLNKIDTAKSRLCQMYKYDSSDIFCLKGILIYYIISYLCQLVQLSVTIQLIISSDKLVSKEKLLFHWFQHLKSMPRATKQ